MTKQEMEQCAEEVSGKITALLIKGLNHPSIIRVEYKANGKTYTLEETVHLKSQPLKIGAFTLGQKRVPTIPNASVGSEVLVKYNATNPHYAYLPENIGLANV